MAGAALAEVSRQHEGTGLCSAGMSTPVSPTSPEAGSRVNIALPRGPGEEHVGGTFWGLQSIPPVLQPEAAPRGSCRPAPDPRTRGAQRSERLRLQDAASPTTSDVPTEQRSYPTNTGRPGARARRNTTCTSSRHHPGKCSPFLESLNSYAWRARLQRPASKHTAGDGKSVQRASAGHVSQSQCV